MVETEIMSDYAHPELLVETEWLVNHLHDPSIRLIELDFKDNIYQAGHIPGALFWDWQSDIHNTLRRNVPDKTTFEALMSRSGITADTTIILYGDRNNLFPTYGFWVLKYYRHADVRLLNGGRKKWLAEGRPITTACPIIKPTPYQAANPDTSIRAMRDMVLQSLTDNGTQLLDVRSPKEYSGELLAPEYLPQEGAIRGGHIPGAVNISWGQTMQSDGRFKSADALQAMYEANHITRDKTTLVYCRIGERSAHSWFVLKYLLGYTNVRNYDGSWVEWGNLIDVPIARLT